MKKAIDRIDEKYLEAFYSLPECEIKTKAFYHLMTNSSLGLIPTEIADYLQTNLLSDSQEPFLLDLLKVEDLYYNDRKVSTGEGGINIKKGWSL